MISDSAIAASNSENNINEWLDASIPDSKPYVSRKDFQQIIELAGLTQALLNRIQKNGPELVAAGADEKIVATMRIQDFQEHFFPTMSIGVQELIESWLADFSKKTFDNFLKQNINNVPARLSEYIWWLWLKVSGAVSSPPGVKERAQCFLVCLYDKRFYRLINALLATGGMTEDKSGGVIYDRIRQLVDDPQLLNESKEVGEYLDLELACCVAIRERDRKVARNLLKLVEQRDKSLPEQDRIYTRLNNYYQKTMPEHRAHVTNVRSVVPSSIVGSDDLEVLTVCDKIKSSHDGFGEHNFAFSKVLAVRLPETDEWVELDDAERRRLFPRSGSIIHFEGKGLPHLPKEQGYAVWRVSEQAMTQDQKAKFDTHYTAGKLIRIAHQIVTLEHIMSSERGKARQWLRHAQELKIPAEGERILRFEDGLFVHTINSYRNLVAGNFTQGLRAWRVLPEIELSSGVRLLVDELPTIDEEFFLTPPAIALNDKLDLLKNYTNHERAKFKEALSNMGNNQAIAKWTDTVRVKELKFTTTQIQELAQLLTQTGSTATQIQELINAKNAQTTESLNIIKAKQERYEKLLQEINSAINTRKEKVKELEGLLEERYQQQRGKYQKDSRELQEQFMILAAMLNNKNSEILGRLEVLEKKLNERTTS